MKSDNTISDLLDPLGIFESMRINKLQKSQGLRKAKNFKNRFIDKRDDEFIRLQKLYVERIKSERSANRKVKPSISRLQGHQPINPSGLCFCGCGQITTIATHDNARYGLIAGDHMRFVNGHYHAFIRSRNPEWGVQTRLAKKREEARTALVKTILKSDGKVSLEEIRDEVAPEFKLNSCSIMVNNARRWGWSDGKIQLFGDIPQIIVRRPTMVIPRYERPEIPNERETEIQLLTNQRFYHSLDKVRFDEGETGHSFIASSDLTPLEILLMKEDQESEEYQERKRRLEEWERWSGKRSSAFYQL